MLSRLQARVAALPADVQERIRTHSGDMRTFELSQHFALVVAPFRAFLHNVTEADQLACLHQIRRHLVPGGRFAFNVFHPSLEYMARHTSAFAIHRLDLAYLYAGDIRRLLAQAGFVEVTIAAGFDGRTELRDTDELVVEAIAPGP